MVACRSWTCTLSLTIVFPKSSVSPCECPPRTPPPAIQHVNACAWCSRPFASFAVLKGVGFRRNFVWRSVRLCGMIAGMSITVELPPDLDQQVRDIPDVEKRVLSFLRDQVEYERWRRERYSDEARRLLGESKEEAARMQAEGVPRAEMVRRFIQAYDKVAEQR